MPSRGADETDELGDSSKIDFSREASKAERNLQKKGEGEVRNKMQCGALARSLAACTTWYYVSPFAVSTGNSRDFFLPHANHTTAAPTAAADHLH